MPLFSDYSMYNYSPPFSPPFYSPTFSNLPSSGASGSGLGGFRGYPSSSFGYPSTSSTGYLPTSSSSPLSQSNFVVSTARNLAAGSSRGYMPHLSSISESPPSPSSLYGRDISPRNIVSKSKLSPHHHYRSKPNFRSTDSIDVSLSRGRKTGNTPAYGGKIQRGRTVVRIQTLRTKDSPGGGNKAKRKTPGERLVEKFLIRDKENDEKSGTWNEMNRNKRNSIKRYISVKKKNSIPSEEKEPPMPSTSLKPEEAAAFRRPSISEAMLREEEAWFDNLILEEMKTADLPGKPRRSSSGDVCPMLERSLSLEDEAPKVSSTRRKSEPKLFLSHKNKFYIRLPSAKDDGSAEDLSLQQLKDGTKRLAARGKKDNVAMMLPTLHEQLPTLDEQSPTLDERVNRTDVTMRATPGDLESDAASDGKKPRLVFTVTDVEIEESLPQSPRKRAPKLVGYEVTVTEDPLSEPNMVVTASERDINSVPQQKSGNVIDEPGLVYRNDVKKKPARNVTTEINVEGSSEFTNSEETKKDVCLKVNGGPEVSAGNTVETKKDGLKNVSVNAVLSKNNHTEKLDEHEQNVALESKSKPIIKISNKKEALNTKNRAKSPSNFNKISETTNSMANDVKYGKDSFARENKLCLNAKKEGTDMDSNILSNFNATEVNPKLKFNHTDVKHKLNLNSTEVKNEQKMSPLNVSKNTDPANSELKNGKTESLSPTQSNKLSAESKLVENTSGMKNKEKVTSAESKPKGEPELKDLNVKLEAHGLNSRPKDKSIDTNSKPNFISTEDKMKQAQLALNLSNNQEPPKLEALNVKEKTGSPISESKLDEMSVNIVGDRGKKNTNVKLEVMKPKHAPKTVETNRLELKKGDPKAADKGLKLDLVQDKSKSPTVDLLEELKGSMQTAGPKKVNDQVLISNLNGSKEIDHSRGVEPKICDDNSDNKTLHADAKSTDRAQKIAESEIKGNTSASTLVPKSNEVKEQINLEILNENALTKEKNFSNTEQQNLQNDISIKTNNMNKTLAAQKIEEDAVENLKGNKTIEEKTQLKLNLSANSKDLNSEAANQQPELMGKKVGAKKKKNIVNKITDKIGLTKNETEVTCCVPDKNKILGKNDKLQGATDLLKEKDGKLGAQSELDIIDKFTGINELSKTEADSNEFYHKKVAAESNDETSIEEKGQKTETKLESGSKESEPKTGSESDLVEDERQRPGNLNKFKKSGTIMKQKLTADKQKNKKGKKVTIVEKLVKKSRNLKNSVSVSKRDKTAIKSAVSAKLDKTSDASDGKEENDDGLGSVKSVSEKVGSASEETNSDESSKDESSSQDEKEEEESSGDESDDESSTCSSKSSRDQGEVKKRYGNRKSTSSEDSGFESLPPSSPAGNFNDKGTEIGHLHYLLEGTKLSRSV